MKYILKLTSFFLLFLLISLASCSDDSHKMDTENEDCLTVVMLPSQCADGPSKVMGLQDANDKFLMVSQGSTNALQEFSVGDRVIANFEEIQDCVLCEACTCPNPDKCIDLKSIEPCNSDGE